MSSDATADRPAEDLAGEVESRAQDLSGETSSRAMALVTSLSETLTEIARRLDLYSAFGRRSRRIIVALAVSFALDIILTVVLGFTAFTAHDTAASNASLVHGLHAAQLQACAGGDVFRSDQNTIWREFISILTAKPAPGTPESQIKAEDKLAAEFLAYVAKVNHPVDCQALYGK